MTTKMFSIIIFIVCLNGCAKNVHFFEQYDNKTPPTNNTVKLYIDAFGSLYPTDGYPQNFIPSEDSDISNGLYTQTTKDPRLCENIESESDAYLLCSSTEDKNKDHLMEWRKAQTLLWQKAAERITQLYLKNSNTELLFLIHGFNNTEEDGKSAYKAIRTEVNDVISNSQKPLFIEIYWDGFLGEFKGAWSKAQSSGPLVGFNLRQLFKGLDESYKKQNQPLPHIKMITHSSGAFIVGALLGNPFSALPDLQEVPEDSTEYKLFYENRGLNSINYPIPDFPSIRVGFIAAATPTTTFAGKLDKKDNGILSKNTTLIFTMNHRDIGLSKLFRIHNLSFLGATGSGADRELYCKHLDKLKENDLGTDAYAYDFRDHNAPFYKTYDGHGVSSYFLQKEQTNLFMKNIFEIGNDETYVDLCL